MALTIISNSTAKFVDVNHVTLPEPLTFEYDINPFLKDSNSYGNIYFARYFEWQGICREVWFSECIHSNMFELEGAFVTKAAHNTYESEVFPFQKIRCYLNVRHVKQASFEIHFKFVDRQTGQLMSQGFQKMAYVGRADKKLIKLPKDILDSIKEYEIR